MFLELLIAVTFLLVISIFFNFYNIRKYHHLKNDFYQFQRLYDYIPTIPYCAYLYYQAAEKKFFYAPTFLKLFNINIVPPNIDFLAFQISEGEVGQKIVNFVKDHISLSIEEIDNFSDTLKLKFRNQDVHVRVQHIVKNDGQHDIIFWPMIVTYLVKDLCHTQHLLNDYIGKYKIIKNIFENIDFAMWYRYNNELTINKKFEDIFGKDNAVKVSRLEDRAKINRNIAGNRRVFQIKQNDNYNFGWGLDITELDQARSNIQNFEQAQKDFLKSSSSAIAVYNEHMRIKLWNVVFVKLWDLDETWLDTNPTYGEILEILRQKRKIPEYDNFQSYKREQLDMFSQLTEPYNEFIYLPNNKTLRLLVLPYAKGGLLFSYEDITDKLSLERSYNTIIEVLKTTMNQLNESVIVFGLDGRVKFYNIIFNHIWGIEDYKVTEKQHIKELAQVIAKTTDNSEITDSFVKDILKVLEQRKPINKQIFINNKHIQHSVVPLPDGSVMLLDQDITNSVNIENKLREVNYNLNLINEMKNNLLTNISYEIRTPLSTILGFSELLHHKLDDNKKQEYIDDIREAGQAINEIVTKFITFDNIDNKLIDIHYAQIDLVKLLNSICTGMEAKIQINCMQDSIIEADANKLAEAIQNIIKNYNVPQEKVLDLRCENNSILLIFYNYYNGSYNKTLDFKDIKESMYADISDFLAFKIASVIIGLHNGTMRIEENANMSNLIVTLPIANHAI